MIGVLVISVFVTLLTTWFLHYFKYEKHLNKIKGPRAWPLFGSALQLGSTTEFLQKVLESRKEFGPIYKVYVGFAPPVIVMSDPKLLEFVMGSTKIIDKASNYSFLHSWLGRGLLTSEGAKWQKHRKILTPAFHFKILEQFIEVFDSHGNILVQKLEKEVGKKSVDIYPYVTLCALDTICATAMGTEVNSQSDSESKYVTSVKEMSRIVIQRAFSVFKMFDFFYQFSKDYQKEREALKILHGYTDSVIQSRKEELIKTNGHSKDTEDNDEDSGIKKRKNFLDLLLQYKKDGQPITDKDIREEVDTFMFEGHDTTAAAMSFALYCLAKNPEAQEKVIEELRSIFGNDKDRPATHRELQEMKYLEAVIKETLRLYPSVPFFARNVHEDVEYDGLILPKNTTLSVQVYALHRDPVTFPDPERFDPERFTQEKQAGRAPYAYVPFSAGPRNCIGQKFAMLEMKSLLSKVLRNYELLEDPEHKLVLAAETVLKSANGIRIGLKKRNF
ncbi:hypothetical protein ILUMI_10731 [Ignelater luminosus]|uniref:Cytochrome P450 n=1 Tax=Ignelater luminosus TaxID=2038154 RepID=A0A8K0CZU7_IGNLU|nr:hypothetical protein ILUMI_10731 [Ignelater luminosus]